MVQKNEEAERRNIICICNHCVELWKFSIWRKTILMKIWWADKLKA